jgi:hypothetical protein
MFGVVWILDVLFRAPFASHIVFKGGSSLSKAYQIIRRFSEDVDLTYDIRALAPDLVGVDSEPLPPNRSQEKRWTKEIRTRLPLWIRKEVVPLITRALSEQKLSAGISTHDEKIFIDIGIHAANSHARIWRSLDRRTVRGASCSLRRCGSFAGRDVSVGESPRHVPGANLLGEGHGNSRILRSRGIPRRRSLRSSLA